MATAIAGPTLVGTDPNRQDLLGRLAPPLGFGGTAAHPLGTDSLGRDLLARLVGGARVSLLVGVAATASAGAIGVTLGAVAGWLGGPVDRALGWLTDVQAALPFVVVAIVATAALGYGLGPVLLTLVLTGWVGYARVVRLQTRAIRRAAWVEAAVALGVGAPRLVIHHVAPHLLGTVAILATQQVSAMILYEASLSYLGLGIGGTAVTWGGMAAAGQESLLKAPWVTAVPGAAVALTVLGLNLLGDAAAER
ncbi:MAG: ABC transporter permease [Chloroflexia bacterium]|nr:ABC transporter permease [Chloroflexia bacterium]